MRFIKIFAFVLLASCTAQNGKIQDCPEEKIMNKMPTVGENSTPKEYYIYKGERKEISDFDKAWLDKNCPNIKVQEVH